jgi:hypothetical protein
MRKRSSYRPRHVNPLAHITALKGASLLDQADRNAFNAPVQAAVDSIAAGVANRDHWQALFDAVNTLEQLFRVGLAEDWREWFEGAQEQVVGILDRQRDTGSRALYPAELATLRELAGTWADILEVVSCREMFNAQAAASVKVRNALAGGVASARIVEALA